MSRSLCQALLRNCILQIHKKLERKLIVPPEREREENFAGSEIFNGTCALMADLFQWLIFYQIPQKI